MKGLKSSNVLDIIDYTCGHKLIYRQPNEAVSGLMDCWERYNALPEEKKDEVREAVSKELDEFRKVYKLEDVRVEERQVTRETLPHKPGDGEADPWVSFRTAVQITPDLTAQRRTKGGAKSVDGKGRKQASDGQQKDLDGSPDSSGSGSKAGDDSESNAGSVEDGDGDEKGNQVNKLAVAESGNDSDLTSPDHKKAKGQTNQERLTSQTAKKGSAKRKSAARKL